MTTFNRSFNNPLRGLNLKIAPLVYGVGLGIGFAALFFNPFTQSNLQFAMRTEPMMFPVQPTDMSIQALIYFAVIGLILAGVRMQIGQRVRGLVSFPVAWIGMIAGSGVLIYGALRLFNPALACMLESCHSTFMLSYGLVTLGFGTLLAYNSNSDYNGNPGLSNYNDGDSRVGCGSGGSILLLIGIILFVGGLLVFTVLSGVNSGGC